MNPQRLEAACRLLMASGDMTPMGMRILLRINEEEESVGDPTEPDFMG